MLTLDRHDPFVESNAELICCTHFQMLLQFLHNQKLHFFVKMTCNDNKFATCFNIIFFTMTFAHILVKRILSISNRRDNLTHFNTTFFGCIEMHFDGFLYNDVGLFECSKQNSSLLLFRLT